MPYPRNTPVSFTTDTARRVATQVKRRERGYGGIGIPPRATAPRNQDGLAGYLAKTSASIPAHTTAGLGHGTVRIWKINDDWSITDTGIDLVVGNWTGGAIDPNKFCDVEFRSGKPVITSVKC